MKSNFDGLHNQIMSAENNMSLTPQGSGGYDMHPETLAPKKKMSLRPQTPAQHRAVEKAGRTSATKRKIAAGLPLISSKPKMEM
jgi:hypothetical protein